MKNTYKNKLIKYGGMLACFLCLFVVDLNAQITAYYTKTNLTGLTYDTLVAGTVINTNAGLSVSMSGDQDDGAKLITLPFTFNYNGSSFTQVTMCTNGWLGMGNQLTVGAADGRAPGNLFTGTVPNNTIGAWFGDMGANFPGVGKMVYDTIPGGRFVVEWRRAIANGWTITPLNLINFKIVLWGPASSTPGRIEILYGSTLGTVTTGRSIGVEDGTGGSNHFINAINGSFTLTTTASAWPGNGNGYRFDPPPPCVDPPTPGIAIGAPACPAATFTLNLSGNSTGLNQTYQWQSSPDGITWSALGSSSSVAAYSTSQAGPTYYRCLVTCGATTLPSADTLIGMSSFINCYCTPTYTSGTGSGDYISLVNIPGTTLNKTSAGAGAPYFTAWADTGINTASMMQGVSYGLTVRGGTWGTCYISGWIDYNQNGVFESTEFIGVSPNCGALTIASFTQSYSIPYTALTGQTKLRLRSSDTGPGPIAGQSCGTTNSSFGETEDFFITILPAPTDDAGLLSFIQPTSSCAGTTDVEVQLKTIGTTPLSSVTIEWMINSVMQTPYSFPGTLTAGQDTNVVIGSMTVASGNIYDIIAWTSQPNGTTDGYPANDTISKLGLQEALSGTYTIGDSGVADYQSFTAAVNDLILRGVCGPVVFEVDTAAGPFIEQITIPSILGANSTNTITFNGNGDTLAAVMTVSANRSVIKLAGADYITFNNLVVSVLTGSTFGWNVSLKNNSNYNTFTNCKFINSITTTSADFIPVVISNSDNSYSTGAVAHHNVFDNNEMVGGYFGVCLYGISNNAGLNNNNFTNNLIRDFNYYGIYFYNVDTSWVSNNNITRPNRTNAGGFYGVTLTGTCRKNIVEKNRMHNAYDANTVNTGYNYCIYTAYNNAPVGGENEVRNNLVYAINNNGYTYGIYNYSGFGTNFYHNTLALDYVASTGGYKYGYYSEYAGRNNFVNNIVYITAGGTGNKYGIYLGYGIDTTSKSNYNDIYVNSAGSGSQYTGQWVAAGQVTLANWQQASGRDTNSIALDPIFAVPSVGNYSPLSPGLDSSGTPLASVVDDINGAPRDTVGPDIGAYEFTPQPFDASVVAVAGPLPNICYTATEDIIITIRNTGTVDLDFSTHNLTVTAIISGAISQTLSTTLMDNSLNSGVPLPSLATLDVALSSADLTTLGTYFIDAGVYMAVDLVVSNDSLGNLYVLNVSAGDASPDTINICNGNSTMVSLAGNTGTIQWESWDGGSWIPESNPGFDANIYPVAPTVNTDYRALVCNMYPTDTVTVLVTTVAIPSAATGDTVCGIGTVNLTATGSGVTWYDDEFGGTALDTGATYSPLIFGTDTFYAASTSGQGLGTPLTTTYVTNNGANGNMFDITALNSVTITSFDGHPSVPTSNWEVWYRLGSYVGFTGSNAGWTQLGSANGVTSNPAGTGTPIPITFAVPIGSGQTVSFFVYSSGGISYTNGTGGVGAVFAADNNIQVKEGAGGGYFSVVNFPRVFNGTVHYSAGCEGPRLPIIAVSTPPPGASINAVAPICEGDSTSMSITSGNAGYTYTWDPATGLSSATGSTVGANPAATTTYIVDAHDATLNCLLKDTVTLTVNLVPVVTVLTADDTICMNNTVQLNASSPAVVTVGAGTGTTTGTGETPFGTFYHDHRTQILYTAADLQADGLYAGPVYSIAFNVPGVAATQVMNAFTISVKNTTTTTMGGWEGGLTQVYTGNYTAVSGWNTFTFDTPFIWDGVSNFLVQVCFDNAAFTSNTSVSYTNTASASQYYGYSDSFYPSPCSAPNQLTEGPTTQRPNARFKGMTILSIPGFNYSWTPGGNLSDATIADPIATLSSATNFTLLVTDAATSCFTVDSSLSIEVVGGFTVNLGTDTAICSNSTFVLDPGAGYTNYMWNDSSTNQTYVIIPGTSASSYSVTVTDSTGCSASDTVIVDLFPQPSVNLGNDTTICITSTLVLDAGAGFSDYFWQDLTPSQTFTIPPGTSSATYFVTILDGNGCSSSDTINVIIDSCVGIDELSLVREISIQPNPSRGIFNITNTGTDLQDAVIEIRNLEGQLVFVEELDKMVTGYRKEVNLTNYAKGIYTIRINSSEGMYINKLVIQ